MTLREAMEEAIRWMTLDENGKPLGRPSPAAATLRRWMEFCDAAVEYMESEAIGTKIPPDMERVQSAAVNLIWAYRAAIAEEGKK